MRGKKYDDETKEKALAMLITSNNIAEISKQLELPESTLRSWKESAEKDAEFVELRSKKKSEFVDRAWNSIDMALKLGEKRIQRALEHESELDDLIDKIIEEHSQPNQYKTQQALIAKVRTLQIQGIKDISTFIGTLYDKQALASGDPTQNIKAHIDMDIDRMSDDELLNAIKETTEAINDLQTGIGKKD